MINMASLKFNIKDVALIWAATISAIITDKYGIPLAEGVISPYFSGVILNLLKVLVFITVSTCIVVIVLFIASVLFKET